MDVSSVPKARSGLEKQEHLVKLAILTTAAILCKCNFAYFSCFKMFGFPSGKRIIEWMNIEVRKFIRNSWRDAKVWVKSMTMSILLNYSFIFSSVFFLIRFQRSAFATRLFSVLRFESVIHEFDPYFNYRTTRFLTEQGFYNFHNWFDDRAWYPLGRIIGGTIYPGLMVTSAALYRILWLLNFTVDIRNVCVFLAPFFSSLTTLVTYLLTKEIHVCIHFAYSFFLEIRPVTPTELTNWFVVLTIVFFDRVPVLVWLQLPWSPLYLGTFQDRWPVPMIMKALPSFACCSRTICGSKLLKLVQYCGQLCLRSHTFTWSHRGAVTCSSSIWSRCMCWLFWLPADFRIAFMWPTAFCTVLEPFYPCKFHSLAFNRSKVPNTCW